jgi:hypothetical protein
MLTVTVTSSSVGLDGSCCQGEAMKSSRIWAVPILKFQPSPTFVNVRDDVAKLPVTKLALSKSGMKTPV